MLLDWSKTYRMTAIKEEFLDYEQGVVEHVHPAAHAPLPVFPFTGVHFMLHPRFCEYEEEKLRSPACCRQEKATYEPYFHLIFT